jgi:hypothetical protein
VRATHCAVLAADSLIDENSPDILLCSFDRHDGQIAKALSPPSVAGYVDVDSSSDVDLATVFVDSVARADTDAPWVLTSGG